MFFLLDLSNCIQEEFILVESIMTEQARWQAHGDSWAHCVHTQEVQKDECRCSPGFLLFIQYGSLAHGMLLLKEWVFSPQLNLFGTSLLNTSGGLSSL